MMESVRGDITYFMHAESFCALIEAHTWYTLSFSWMPPVLLPLMTRGLLLVSSVQRQSEVGGWCACALVLSGPPFS